MGRKILHTSDKWTLLDNWCGPDAVLAKRLRELATLREIPRDQLLLSAGDAGLTVHFTLAGAFSVLRYSTNGNEVRLSTLRASSWIGEMAALSGKPRSAFVIAAENGLVATLSTSDFLGLMEAHGTFATKIASLLCERLDETSQRMFEFASASSPDRVYAEMMRLSSPNGNPDVRYISPAPSVTEIAARLSMARETASRTLGQLEKMRLLKREPAIWRIVVKPQRSV